MQTLRFLGNTYDPTPPLPFNPQTAGSVPGSLVGPRPGSWPVGRVVGDYFGGWKHSPGGGSYLDGISIIQATLSNLCFSEVFK